MDQPLDINKRVGQYVALRDKINEIKEKHKAELAPYNEALDQLNSLLLDHLNSVGGDSVKTASGTVYKTGKKSATIADKTAFWAWVVANGDWDLLDYKANANAVAEHVEKNGTLPPGVNLTTNNLVGVRRS
jgi:hypothetical protein